MLRKAKRTKRYSTTLKDKRQEEELNSKIIGSFLCAPQTTLKDLPQVDPPPHTTMIIQMTRANSYQKLIADKRQITQVIGHHLLTYLKKVMMITMTKKT